MRCGWGLWANRLYKERMNVCVFFLCVCGCYLINGDISVNANFMIIKWNLLVCHWTFAFCVRRAQCISCVACVNHLPLSPNCASNTQMYVDKCAWVYIYRLIPNCAKAQNTFCLKSTELLFSVWHVWWYVLWYVVQSQTCTQICSNLHGYVPACNVGRIRVCQSYRMNRTLAATQTNFPH